MWESCRSTVKKGLLAFGMVDETYALTMDRIRKAGYNPGYQLGSNASFYVAWVSATAVGALTGERIPDPLAWGLDFAMPAMFLALLHPPPDGPNRRYSLCHGRAGSGFGGVVPAQKMVHYHRLPGGQCCRGPSGGEERCALR
ncbi:MAG: AzlC family ABC transporter permease [Eubacteriales bacterium]|nr:AzlC family ABC transporter permease [Eubacteriales bacterium]